MFLAREGDFIETVDELIFDVKGLVHPEGRVVAYIRYYPNPQGDRVRKGVRYSKIYSLKERDSLIKKVHPQYRLLDPIFGDYIEEVPVNMITRHYKPVDKLRELRTRLLIDETEKLALELADLLKVHSGIRWRQMGISGSILLGLHEKHSDLDIIVYGTDACASIYKALADLLQRKNSPIKPYGVSELRKLHEFRSKDTRIPLSIFMQMERRKRLQGTFKGRDYFIRFVKDWSEVSEKYGDKKYSPIGYSKIKAKVIDDSNGVFTPCSYLISQVEVLSGAPISSIKEVASFRGRFCEQAKINEWIIAQGKLEKVTPRDGDEYFRLLLGGLPTDFMIVVKN
jgi:predicted nucleotidyltransferase